MPDIPAPDAHDPRGPFLAQIRHLLDDPTFQLTALTNALEFGEVAARAAWEASKGQKPLDRLLLALQAAAEELEGLGTAMAEVDPQEGEK